jgi:DNA-binding transcriptional LysR family regulator
MSPSRSTIDARRDIVQAELTSGGSTDVLLGWRTELGIEHYVTQAGDLMVRVWQVGSENFVSSEEAARLRELLGADPPKEIDALEWVSRNLARLKRDYPGRWIAVAQGRVVAEGATAAELLSAVEAGGIERPFVTQIPSRLVRRYTAYASQSNV